MPSLYMIITSVVLVAVMVYVFFFLKRESEEEEERTPNYRAMFVIGLTWIPLGLTTKNYLLPIGGLVFMMVGLAHRDKWNDQPKWGDLSKEKKWAWLILIMFVILLGIGTFFFAKLWS